MLKEIAKALFRDGVAVFDPNQVAGEVEESLAQELANAMLLALQRFGDKEKSCVPEKNTPGVSFYSGEKGGKQFFQPGFGGSSLPTTNHAQETRALRRILDRIFRELGKELCKIPEVAAILKDIVYFVSYFERYCQRLAGTCPSAENEHRDVSPDWINAQRNCLIFGGYLALQGDQYFTCCPGTHLLHKDPNEPTGFAKLSDDQKKMFKDKRVTYKVPEGHVIIFFENIVHSVRSAKYDYDILRLFVAFQLWSGAPPCTATSLVRKPKKPCDKCMPCYLCPKHTPCDNRDSKGRACGPCTQFYSVSDDLTQGGTPPVKSGQPLHPIPALYYNFRATNGWRISEIYSQIPTMVEGCKKIPAVSLEKPYTPEERKMLRGYPLFQDVEPQETPQGQAQTEPQETPQGQAQTEPQQPPEVEIVDLTVDSPKGQAQTDPQQPPEVEIVDLTVDSSSSDEDMVPRKRQRRLH
jgi:hypothetical protein